MRRRRPRGRRQAEESGAWRWRRWRGSRLRRLLQAQRRRRRRRRRRPGGRPPFCVAPLAFVASPGFLCFARGGLDDCNWGCWCWNC
uniref:Uncharacterized protein n=1 Tax=Arundo donax TaxID=35708 RepID=A0A0A9GHN6_ARUDO